MGIINYSGKLPAAVFLQWKGDIVANAVTTSERNHRYVTANESLTALTVKLEAGGKPIVLSRRASAKQRFFDDALHTYTTRPVAGADLDDLLAAGTGTKGTIACTFTYARFFAAVLQQMTRVDDDLRNLADPEHPAAILDTFTYSNAGGNISIGYKTATQTIKALPCTLADFEVRPGPAGKPPAVKLVLELDFLTSLDAVRKAAMLKLMAMDWSKLARFGTPEAFLSRVDVRLWWDNVKAYLANHTDIARGERFRSELVTRHRGKTARALATDLRNDVDRLMITANHWGQAREDMKTEHYQRLLSDLFGTLHQTRYLASPVSYLRELRPDRHLSGINKSAALALQYGAGHCGEHAQISFSVLEDIIADPDSKVVRVIYAGNANIDHEFVVVDLDVDTVLHTIPTAKKNPVWRSDDGTIDVWNLREAIAKNAPREGFVLDPYLDKTVMKPTTRELLEALNNRKRKASHKDTDFLRFVAEFPPAFTSIDISKQSEAERRALVPNV